MNSNNFARYFPWIVLGLGTLYLIAMMAPPKSADNQMHLAEFASLPILDNGRVKPFDTVARNSLMIISGKQTFEDDKGKTQPAIKWLLDVMTSGPIFQSANEKKGTNFPLAGEKHKVFRIDNPQVLAMLGLQDRPGFRYAIDEFAARWPKLRQEADKAEKKDSKKRNLYEAKVIELDHHLQVYLKLSYWPQTMFAVPPLSSGEEWQRFRELPQDGPANSEAGAIGTIVVCYAHEDVKAFNEALDAYRKQIDKPLASEVRMGDLETFFNHFAPFYQCTILYVFVFVLACVSFVLACVSWRGWSEPLNRSAFWLAVLTLVVHSWAILTRMYLQGRPPVTNLYSSAVFIGWGCVALGLALEALFRNGAGNVVAAVMGGLTMLIAHHLAGSGDTLEMLQAVLDTNFWLATHVTCVTLGYMATLVAGILAWIYILLGVLTPALDKSLAKVLGQMLYGVVCFATLLSFTGTVLGGIWADQSWGRFWGWDPKENGALLIVIWNALILHARWGGMVRERGMAVLAVIGNMVTGWSWFGTNQLGVGLHAYGFNDTLATGLVIYWAFNIAFIVMGLLPLRWWASYAVLTAPARPILDAGPPRSEKPFGKRRGKRAKRGDPGFFPGPA